MAAVRVATFVSIAPFLLFAANHAGASPIPAAVVETPAAVGSAEVPPTVASADEVALPEDTPTGDGAMVIPAGQDELLGDMLGRGAELPDGCQFVSGDVEFQVVKARYQCPSGEVMLQLVHPSEAASSATRTERFAIILQSGSPPESLLPALQARIRSREATFRWHEIIQPSTWRTLFKKRGAWVFRIGILALVGIGIIGWLVRRRGASKKST